MPFRLLLVEDDAVLARAVGRLLRRAGYDVVVAGRAAEARCATGPFSLGIFDIDLPDGDGVDLAYELLDSGLVRRVVFFSGTPEAEQRQRALRLGPFVNKAQGFPVLRLAIEGATAREREKVVGGESRAAGDSSSPPPSGVRSNGKNTAK